MYSGIRWLMIGVVLAAAACSFAQDESPAYDARLTGYEYPFPVSFFKFESQQQDLEMAYMHLVGAKGKPTVVLLHGKNFAADYWARTAEHLHEKGYSVLMPDQIGFGKSSKPERYQFSLEALAHNTQRLMAKLEIENPIVMGHSMGGMLAMRYGLMYGDEVERLVLVNPIGLEDYLDYVQYKDMDFFYRDELGKSIDDIRQYQRKHYYDGKWSEDYEKLIQIHAGWLNGEDWQRIAWNNALTYDMIFTGNVVDEFEELQVPTYLIIGTRDTTGPGRGWKKPGVDYQLGQYDKLGQRAAQKIPQAQLMEIPGIGHLPQFEAFDLYRQKLDKIFK